MAKEETPGVGPRDKLSDPSSNGESGSRMYSTLKDLKKKKEGLSLANRGCSWHVDPDHIQAVSLS